MILLKKLCYLIHNTSSLISTIRIEKTLIKVIKALVFYSIYETLLKAFKKSLTFKDLVVPIDIFNVLKMTIKAW